MGIDPKLVDIVTVPELDNATLAVTNLFAHSAPNGTLGKATINQLATFIAPYIESIGASGYIVAPGYALPAPATPNGFTLVADGIFTQPNGPDITTTSLLNVLSYTDGVWTLAVATDTSELVESGGSDKTLSNVDRTSLKLNVETDFVFNSVAIPSMPGGGIIKTENNYKGVSSTADFRNFGIANLTIGRGETKYFEVIYRGPINETAIFALKETNTAESYSSNNYKVGFYFFDEKVNVLDNGPIVDQIADAIIGSSYRIYCDYSGAERLYKLQQSSDNITYNDIYTFDYDFDAEMYAVVNILANNTQLEDIIVYTDPIKEIENKVDAVSYTTLGVIYSKSSWDNLSDFVLKGGVTASVVANKIRVSGGTGTFLKFLGINRPTNLPYWKMVTTIKILENGNTAYGAGQGHYTTNSFNDGASTVVTMGRYEFNNAGIARGTAIFNYGYTNAIAQEKNETFITNNVNDIVVLTTERSGMLFRHSVQNLTQMQSLDFNFPYFSPPLQTSGLMGLFSLGGLFEVQDILLTSDVPKKADLVVVWDSKGQLYNASSDLVFWVSNLFRHYPNKKCVNFSGGYDTTADILLRLPEILLTIKQGTIVDLCVGSNDKRLGVPFATWRDNYASITNQLTNAGADVRHTMPLEENSGLDFSDYIAYINATFLPKKIITVALNMSTDISDDDVHPNDNAQPKIFSATALNIGSF